MSQTQDSVTPGPDAPRQEPIRLLIADDHKILRDGLARLLGGERDIEVVGQASNGAMAIEMAHRLLPDIVLMDVSMPGVSGIEATRRLRLELPEVRVIGLSMHEPQELAVIMKEAGAVAYLTKSAGADVLLWTIRQHASEGRS